MLAPLSSATASRGLLSITGRRRSDGAKLISRRRPGATEAGRVSVPSDLPTGGRGQASSALAAPGSRQTPAAHSHTHRPGQGLAFHPRREPEGQTQRPRKPELEGI